MTLRPDPYDCTACPNDLTFINDTSLIDLKDYNSPYNINPFVHPNSSNICNGNYHPLHKANSNLTVGGEMNQG